MVRRMDLTGADMKNLLARKLRWLVAVRSVVAIAYYSVRLVRLVLWGL